MSNIFSIVKRNLSYLLIVALGIVLRIVNFDYPKKFIMDEAYYVPDGFSIFKYGYEVRWVEFYKGKWTETISSMFVNPPVAPYSLDYMSTHPPFGKMLIGFGALLFNPTNTVGWRISVLIFGISLIILTMYLTKLIFKNKAITLFAGFFIAIDGMAISMSRVSMLDMFLTVFVILGFIFCVKFLQSSRMLFIVLMGLSFGLSVAVKWSGAYFFIVALALVCVFYIKNKKYADGLKNILMAGATAVFVYFVTWVSWLISYAFNYKQGGLFQSLSLFVSNHLESIKHAATIDTPHNYKSNALEWLVMSRPTMFKNYFDDVHTEIISGMPNLFIWFFGLVSLIIISVLILKKHFKIEVAVIPLAFLAGWIPWVFVGNRTVFNFYVISFLPYVYIALAAVIVISLKTISNKIIRIFILLLIFAIVMFSFLNYPYSVGLPIEFDNPIFRSYHAIWMNWCKSMGLYDVSQLPVEVDIPWPNLKVSNGQ